MTNFKKIFSPLNLFAVAKTFIAILIGFSIAGIIIFMVADDAGEAFKLLLTGPLTSVRRFSNVIEMAIPLTFTAVAVCIVFRARQFTMIAEGSFFAGGLVATIVALNPKLPESPVLPMLAGILIGGLIASIPAILKAKLNASELVASLMLNYIVLYLCQFIFNNYMRDPSASTSVSYEYPEATRLNILIPKTRLHSGLFIALAVVAFAYFLLFHTTWGYKIRIVGINKNFAICSGISATATIIYSQVLCGAIAGLGGAVEILGMYKRFSWVEFPKYGFDGIIIATIAYENPLLVPFAAFFLAYLRVGADIMSRSTTVSNEVVAIIQGVIILLVSAGAFLSKWRHRIVVKESNLSNLDEEGGV